ncbi:hypothetical protein AX17_005349 [Amanita inopinata Kibby_2008]|nr:hypothetical protein AX17_005349 [Amanita inopinata Kibby_2008]
MSQPVAASDPQTETRHIQFEAPMSANSQQLPLHVQRTSERFSIDLSLELEHQLEHMESSSLHHADTDSNRHSGSSSAAQAHSLRESLDPHVLAHIIMQLRQSLAEMTKDRDELVKALSSALSKEAELNDAMQLMTDKATGLEENLAEARKKMTDDEDAITLLRSKVEESRRGLMRLQSESRRQSGNFELSRGAISSAFGGSPPASKRASFTPLTGSLHASRPNGHRRISSVSDTGFPIHPDLQNMCPISQHFPASDGTTGAPLASRRVSGFFGRQSPPQLQTPELSLSNDASLTAELESLKKVLQAAKDELENTKHELSESNEAREASETCVKALREFIAENNVGATDVSGPAAIKLPPLPMMTTGEEMESQKTSTVASAGWGFGKLWKVDTAAKTPTAASAASTASPVVAPTPQTSHAASATTMTPLTKKLGGFFSSRSSISSTATSITSGGGAPQLQTNAALTATCHRESIYSFSDASSIAEPISPSGEANGTAPSVVVSESMASGELGFQAAPASEGKDAQVGDERRALLVG